MAESALLTPSKKRAHSLILAPSSLRPAINQSNAVPSEEEIVSQSVTEIAALNQSIFIDDPLNPSKIAEASINQSPRLRFEQSKPSRSIDYQYDGDMSMESDQMINQRRALKLDPLIQTWINVFWKTYRKTEVQIPSDVYEQSINQSIVQTGTTNGRHSISSSINQPASAPANQAIKMVTISGIPKSEYLRVHSLMYRCLHATSSTNSASIQPVNQSVGLKDWTRDIWLSSSPHILDENAHFASLFELVDTWTLSVEKDEYAHFLAVLFHRITRIRSWLVEADPNEPSINPSTAQSGNGMVLQSKYVWRRLKHVNNASCYRPFNYAKYSAIRWKRWQQVLHQVDEDETNLQSNNQSSEETSSEFDSQDVESSEDEYTAQQAINQAKRISAQQSRAQSAISLTVESPEISEASSARSVTQSGTQSTSRSANQSNLSRPRTGDYDSEAWRVSSDDSITSSDEDSDDSQYAQQSVSMSMPINGHDDAELERAKRQLAQLEATKAELRAKSTKKLNVSLVPPDVSMLGTAPPSPAVTSGDDSEIDEQTLQSINQAVNQSISQSGEMARLTELQAQLTLAEQTIIQRRDEVEHDLIATIQSINQSTTQSTNQSTNQSNAVSGNDDESATHSSAQSSAAQTPQIRSTIQSTHHSPKAINQSVNQPVNQPITQPINQLVNQPISHPPVIIELLSTSASIEAADILASYGLSPTHKLSARTAHELGVQALKTRPVNQSINQNEVDKLISMIEAVQITRDQSKTLKEMKKRVKSINQSSNKSGEHGELDEIAEYIHDIMNEKKAVPQSISQSINDKKTDKKKTSKTVPPAKPSKKPVEKTVKQSVKPVPEELVKQSINQPVSQPTKTTIKKPVRKPVTNKLSEPIVEESEAELEKAKTPREPEPSSKTTPPINQSISQSLEEKLASARAREKLPEPVIEKPVEKPKQPTPDQSGNQSINQPIEPADKISKSSLVKKMVPPPVMMKPVLDQPVESVKKVEDQPVNQSMIDKIKQSLDKPKTPVKVNPPPSQPVNQSVNKPVEQPKPVEKPAPKLKAPVTPPVKKEVSPKPAPVNQSVSQPINQPVKAPAEQPKPVKAVKPVEPVKEPVNQPISQPVKPQVQQPTDQSVDQSKLPPVRTAPSRPMSPPIHQPVNQSVNQSRPPSRPSSASVSQSINQSRPSSASYRSRPSSRQSFSPTPIRPFDQSNNQSTNQSINMGFAPIDTSMDSDIDSPAFSPIVYDSDTPQSVNQSFDHLSPTNYQSINHSNNQSTNHSKQQSPFSYSSRLNSQKVSRPSSRAGPSNNQSTNQSISQSISQVNDDGILIDEFGNELLSSRSNNDQSVNQSVIPSNNQSTSQSINQSRSQTRPTTASLMVQFAPSLDESVDQSPNQSIDAPADDQSVEQSVEQSRESINQSVNRPVKKLNAAERFALRQREREAAQDSLNQSRQAFYESEQSQSTNQSINQPIDQSINQSIEDSLRAEQSRLADVEMTAAHQSINLSTRWSMRAKEVDRANARARSKALSNQSISQLELKWQAKQEKLMQASIKQSINQAKMQERKAERERRRQAVNDRREALKQAMREKQMIERLVDSERCAGALYRARAELEDRSQEARALLEATELRTLHGNDVLSPFSLLPLAVPGVRSLQINQSINRSEKRQKQDERRAVNAANRAALAAERVNQLEQWKSRTQMSALRQQQLIDSIEAAHRAKYNVHGQLHAVPSPEARAASEAEEAVISELTQAIADDWSFAVASGFNPGVEMRPSVVDVPVKLPRLAQVPSAAFAPSVSQSLNQSIITIPSLLSPRVVAAAASRLNAAGFTTNTGVSHEHGHLDHTLMVPTAEAQVTYLTSHSANQSVNQSINQSSNPMSIRFRDPPPGALPHDLSLGLNEFIANHPLVAALTSRGLFPNHQPINKFDLRSTFSTSINPSDQSELLSVRANIRRELVLAKDRDRLRVDSEVKKQRLEDVQSANQSINQSIARRYEEKIARIESMRKQRDSARELRRLERLVEAARRKEERKRRQQNINQQQSIDASNKLAEMAARDLVRKKMLDQQLEKQMWARLAAKIDRESKEMIHKWKGESEQKEPIEQSSEHSITQSDSTNGQFMQNNYVNPLNSQTVHQSWQHHLDQRARSLAMKQIMRRDFDASINQSNHDDLAINMMNTYRPSRRPRVHAHGLNPAGYIHPSYRQQSNSHSIVDGLPGLTVVKQQPAKRSSSEQHLMPLTHIGKHAPLQFTDDVKTS